MGSSLAGCEIEGSVNLTGVQVLTQAHFSEVKLKSPGSYALIAHNMRVVGAMSFSTDVEAVGECSLIEAEITGQFSLMEAILRNEHKRALDLERATVGHLLLPMKDTPQGEIDLVAAKIDGLVDNWPETSYSRRLRGLVYQRLDPLPRDISGRLDWLKGDVGGYSTQPYEQLANVLRRTGRSDAARQVSVQKEVRRRPELKTVSRLWNVLLAITVGYGYRAWLGILWLTAFVLVGWGVFAAASADHDMMLVGSKTQAVPQFHSWLYSLDSVLPVVNLGQKSYWSPTGLALYWHTVSVLAGWLLITLILGALTTRLVRD